MPELPEVEVVRAGLGLAATGARVMAVEVRDPRALKRHIPVAGDDGLGGHGVTLAAEAGLSRAADFEQRMTGALLGEPVRRGKFMWFPVLASESEVVPAPEPVAPLPEPSRALLMHPHPPQALLVHLGMSGQMLLRTHEAPDDRHVRIRLWIEHPDHGELRVDFADQRLFGSLAIDALVPEREGSFESGASEHELSAHTTSSATSSELIPTQVTHIARDPLDPLFDGTRFVAVLRSRRTPLKQTLLDQRVVSGIGNIYADEALWRARLHPETPAGAVSERKARELLSRVREVFARALAEGGTSFDAQYVNVNGQAGYFAHSLNAYGRGGEPCHRCGTPIRRLVLGGRSSHFCPRCQRRR